MRHPRKLLATTTAALLLTAAGCNQPQPPDEPEPSPTTTSQPPKAGENNSITDVAGIKIGQTQRAEGQYLTGTTVAHLTRMSITGVDVAGGAPGTRETALLSPVESNPGANAIVLSGGSAYGLATADGVMRALENKGEGYPVGDGKVVPIVPAAILYDLGRGGAFSARPTAKWGVEAFNAAHSGNIQQGTVGAGTGAMAGGLKGGIGTASVKLDNGTTVAALVAVNAAGSTVNPTDCTLLGANKLLPGELAWLRTPNKGECRKRGSTDDTDGGNMAGNTTIALVATDASLSKAAAKRMAQVAQDGLARAIDPVHTLADGDTVFATATGEGKPLQVHNRGDGGRLNAIYAAGSDTLTRAVVHAMVHATPAAGSATYCGKYPSACRDRGNMD